MFMEATAASMKNVRDHADISGNTIMKAPLLLVCFVFGLSCNQPTMRQAIGPEHNTSHGHVMLHDTLDQATLKNSYSVVAPKVWGAFARWDSGAIVLTIPSESDEIVVSRMFDVSSARGLRIRLRVRVRTEGAAKSFARATMTVLTSKTGPSYHDSASTSTSLSRAIQWTDVHTVIDVPPDAVSGKLELVLHGKGTAWFNEVEIMKLGPAPIPGPVELTSQQISNLATFSRAAALIRYLHPSDQAATTDWNAFLPTAIGQLIRSTISTSHLADDLAKIFKSIAPTVEFATMDNAVKPATPSRGAGTHLVRWRRHGFAAAPPYREGRDADTTSATASIRLDSAELVSCKKISFRIAGQSNSRAGKTTLVMRVFQPAKKSQELVEAWPDLSQEALLSTALPDDVRAIEIGLRVENGASAQFDTLSMSCDGGTPRDLDIERASWLLTDFKELYIWQISRSNGRPCASLRRKELDTVFIPERDILNADIGNGITMHLPIAVWADSDGTLPFVPQKPFTGDFTIDDVEVRIATILAAWGTLSVFYPYFGDQSIDWLAALAPAIKEAAAARSPVETRIALCHLNTHLQDNHGKITHSGSPITGTLPITVRRFGSKIVINGGLPEYLQALPIGSELLEIQGTPAIKVYDQMSPQVPAATEGLHEYLTSSRITMGNPGDFWSLRIRDLDGRNSDHIVPLVNDELYAHANREPRPADGAELAPSIYYLDLDELSVTTWNALLPKLEHARVIILDFRGYGTNVVYEALSHLTDQELKSPLWEAPIVPSFDGTRFTSSQWSVFPKKPRLKAKIIMLIDGRSMSAVETVLQIFREHKLGILVGEPSAGANGNVGYIDLPGGFTMRFTALRAASSDGTTIHGHGFKPDFVVRPTIQGIRGGRDEILEAAVKIAQGF